MVVFPPPPTFSKPPGKRGSSSAHSGMFSVRVRYFSSPNRGLIIGLLFCLFKGSGFRFQLICPQSSSLLLLVL